MKILLLISFMLAVMPLGWSQNNAAGPGNPSPDTEKKCPMIYENLEPDSEVRNWQNILQLTDGLTKQKCIDDCEANVDCNAAFFMNRNPSRCIFLSEKPKTLKHNGKPSSDSSDSATTTIKFFKIPESECKKLTGKTAPKGVERRYSYKNSKFVGKALATLEGLSEILCFKYAQRDPQAVAFNFENESEKCDLMLDSDEPLEPTPGTNCGYVDGCTDYPTPKLQSEMDRGQERTDGVISIKVGTTAKDCGDSCKEDTECQTAEFWEKGLDNADKTEKAICVLRSSIAQALVDAPAPAGVTTTIKLTGEFEHTAGKKIKIVAGTNDPITCTTGAAATATKNPTFNPSDCERECLNCGDCTYFVFKKSDSTCAYFNMAKPSDPLTAFEDDTDTIMGRYLQKTGEACWEPDNLYYKTGEDYYLGMLDFQYHDVIQPDAGTYTVEQCDEICGKRKNCKGYYFRKEAADAAKPFAKDLKGKCTMYSSLPAPNEVQSRKAEDDDESFTRVKKIDDCDYGGNREESIEEANKKFGNVIKEIVINTNREECEDKAGKDSFDYFDMLEQDDQKMSCIFLDTDKAPKKSKVAKGNKDKISAATMLQGDFYAIKWSNFNPKNLTPIKQEKKLDGVKACEDLCIKETALECNAYSFNIDSKECLLFKLNQKATYKTDCLISAGRVIAGFNKVWGPEP